MDPSIKAHVESIRNNDIMLPGVSFGILHPIIHPIATITLGITILRFLKKNFLKYKNLIKMGIL